MLAVRDKKLSIRAASCACGIPRSTLYDYLTGKVEIECGKGPDSVLIIAEEQCLVSLHIYD